MLMGTPTCRCRGAPRAMTGGPTARGVVGGGGPVPYSHVLSTRSRQRG
uniref:Uncharacterized protein n=1 Tax=Arundo donax TaxID=35708 RepID=A0A0A8Z3W7_ARUDO